MRVSGKNYSSPFRARYGIYVEKMFLKHVYLPKSTDWNSLLEEYSKDWAVDKSCIKFIKE